MDLIREVMIKNFQISFVTNVKFDIKARGTQMGRPYPAQYLGRGVPGSKLKSSQNLLYRADLTLDERKFSETSLFI